jgi:hypothetical protein
MLFILLKDFKLEQLINYIKCFIYSNWVIV